MLSLDLNEALGTQKKTGHNGHPRKETIYNKGTQTKSYSMQGTSCISVFSGSSKSWGKKRNGENLTAFVQPDLEQRYGSLTGMEIHPSV